MTLKVISGGQTGADRTALLVARELGIETGGWAPKGWLTDEGPDPSLATFGLQECSFLGYRVRTRLNVRNADATVLFGDTTSPGCTLTKRACVEHAKPFVENPTADDLYRWLLECHPRVLNVAGNRHRLNPGIETIVRGALRPALVWYRDCLERPSPVESTPEEEREETAAAIAAIEAHTPDDWRETALSCLHTVALRQRRLTSEDVWRLMPPPADGAVVHDNRAMGPIMLAGQRAGWIVRTPDTKNAEQMAHNRPLRVWESRLCLD